MSIVNIISGVFAAAVTPLNLDGTPDVQALPKLIDFLVNRGCHGLLFLGTTGEGPSFSAPERAQVFRSVVQIRQAYPSLRLLAGTGTPSFEETAGLTHLAFDLGFDGVVVLPPYYFRKVNDDGLFSWFDTLLHTAVPSDGKLLGYHIPPVTGIGFSLDLLARLKDAHPVSFCGIKDSSGDSDFARQLGKRFMKDLVVLNGNDRLFSLALESYASGCITAMANLYSPLLRKIWDDYSSGKPTGPIQEKLTRTRMILDQYPPMPPLIKALLHKLFIFPLWTVKLPLLPFPEKNIQIITDSLNSIVD